MKRYITEKNMVNNTDGYFDVVVEGERHLNRVRIRSSIQQFSTQSGYDFCHPLEVAKQNAEAIANGLNRLELEKNKQNRKVVDVTP